MTSASSNQLLKLLGVSFGIAVTVGGTLGAGILRMPGVVASQLGDPWLILMVWCLVGVYALLGALCAIELSVAMPQAGSWYVYSRRAFGSYIAFITGITSWAGTVTAMGFGAYTMAEFLVMVVPRATHWSGLIAMSILFLLACFHWRGTESSGKSQEVMAIIKALGFIIFVGCCFWFGPQIPQYDLSHFNHQVKTPALIIGLISALQAVFYTYDGWHIASYFSEENTDATKNLPKAMIFGVLSVIGIYLLFNGALLYILPMEVLQHATLPAAEAVKLLFGPQAAKLVTIFLVITIFGLLNAQIMFGPRVIYSMSRDGLFWRSAQKINPRGTPIVAMPLTAGLAIFLISTGKENCAMLSNIAAFFFVLSYSAGFASLIRLRQTEPNLHRPFKTPFYPYVPYGLLITSLLFLFGTVIQDIHSSRFALYFIVLSYPLYKWVRKSNILQSITTTM